MKAATLRAIRAKLDETLHQFAEKVGYGAQSISEMERSKRQVPVTLALAVLARDAGITDPEPPEARILNGD